MRRCCREILSISFFGFIKRTGLLGMEIRIRRFNAEKIFWNQIILWRSMMICTVCCGGDDPLNRKKRVDLPLWDERNSHFAVEKYAGDSLETVRGRFWIFKETPLSSKESSLLEKRGISIYDRGVYQGWSLILLKSDSSILKRDLNEDLASFYNAIPVNDTGPLPIDLSDYRGDSTALELSIDCWPDIDVSACMKITEKCGAFEVFYAYRTVLASLPFDYAPSVRDCLSRNRDVRHVGLVQEGLPANDNARNAIHLSELQNSEAWQRALGEDSVTMEWLKNEDYTGEGIVVGLYDTGMDTSHPDFRELDSNGVSQNRLIRKSEYFGSNWDFITKKQKLKMDTPPDGWHGTNVAGIIGGLDMWSIIPIPMVHMEFMQKKLLKWMRRFLKTGKAAVTKAMRQNVSQGIRLPKHPSMRLRMQEALEKTPKAIKEVTIRFLSVPKIRLQWETSRAGKASAFILPAWDRRGMGASNRILWHRERQAKF